MQQSSENNPTSWIEDLDPEPVLQSRFWQWCELIFGLVLLLAVLGWAGWQWMAQAHNDNEYSLGEQALRDNNLEEAVTHFGSIPDYKDAGSRARDIEAKIQERDLLNQQLTTGYQSGNWLQAYGAAQKLTKAVPGDTHVNTLLNTAREHIYTEALSGTVVSRLDADPPGLYYRAGDKWVWFVDSDASSRILGTGPPGHMVYDITITDQGLTPGRRPGYGLEGSSLMLATFTSGGPTFRPLALDPHAFDYFIWGDDGVWGLKDRSTSATRQVNGPNTFYAGYDIVYEAYSNRTPQDMKPKGSGWVLIDFAPDGKQVLLADVSKVNSSHPWIGLYVADGDGTNLRLLYSFDGKFQRAIFSPDSRYVLLSTFSRFDYDFSAGKQMVVLLDTAGQHPSRVLAQADKSFDSTTYYLDHSLSSTFLQSGPYTGKILLVDTAANQTTSISIIDPDTSSLVVPKLTLQADLRQADFSVAVQVLNDWGLELVFQGNPIIGDPYLIFVRDGSYARAGEAPTNSALALDWERMDLHKGDSLHGIWLTPGGDLAYMLAKKQTSSQATQDSVTARPDKLLWADTTTPQHLTAIFYSGPDYYALDNYGGSIFPGHLPTGDGVAAGPGMLAFCHPGTDNLDRLEVINYDGTSAVTISGRTCQLYNWSQYPILRGLR